MPTEQTASCTLALSAEQLSTWRAQGLDPAEAARIAAHAAACDACRATLADFDAVDRALREQVVPAPSTPLWEELEPRLSYGSAFGAFGWRTLPPVIAMRTALRTVLGEHRRDLQADETLPPAVAWPRGVTRLRLLSSPRARVITSVATLAALLLVVVGFASILHGRASPPPLTLAWQQGTFPAGMALSELGNFESIVPAADGNTAFTCIPTTQEGQAQVQIWVTHDRALRWVHVSDLPALPVGFSHCGLTVDMLRPEIALAVASNVVFGSPTVAYATFDGGATWRSVTDTAMMDSEFATLRGVTYTATHKGILVSHDQMRTWTNIGPPLTGRIPVMSEIRIRPDTGALLATVIDYGRDRSYVWTSNDGGQHWSQMQTPRQHFFEVQQPLAGQPWHLCGWPYATGTAQGPGGVDCSWDGGQTWTSYPSPTPSVDFVALSMTDSGDLLAEGTTPWSDGVYRLSPATGSWQSLGTPPGDWTSPLIYATAPGNGVLWRVMTELAYETKPVSEAHDLAITAIYTADYPAR